MAASQPGVFNVQQFTDDGSPAASHRLYTYAQGTTTHKAAFTNAAGTISHSYTSDGIGGLYIALNARGELPAPLFLASGAYDLALKTPSGATVWTRYAEGAGQGAFTAAGTGAVVRTQQAKARDIVSSDDYGNLAQALAAVAASAGILWVTPGVKDVTAITVPAGVTMRGYGPYASVIRTTSATATVITMQTSAQVRDLKVLSSVTRTGGFYVDMAGNGNIVENCEFSGHYIAINAGVLNQPLIVGPEVVQCRFSDPAVSAGSGAVQFINFSNAIMRSCIITGTSIGTTQPDFGVRFQNGDTAFISDTNVTVNGKALLVDPPFNYNIFALEVSNSIFDSAGTITGGTTVSSAELIPGGGIFNAKFSNCWFGLSANKSGCFVQPTGLGTVDGLDFTGCDFVDNGDCGLLCSGTSVLNWTVTGGSSGGNTDAGIRAADGTLLFTINGHRAGNVALRGANNYGIKVDAFASNNYTITGNNLIGNTTAGLLDQGTGTTKQVSGNLGHSNDATLTVGASPYTYTNTTGSPQVLYIRGGTVSSVTVGGWQVASATNCAAPVPHGLAAVITYSSLPAIDRREYS